MSQLNKRNKKAPILSKTSAFLMNKTGLFLHYLPENIIAENKYHQGYQYYKANNLGAF